METQLKIEEPTRSAQEILHQAQHMPVNYAYNDDYWVASHA